MKKIMITTLAFISLSTLASETASAGQYCAPSAKAAAIALAKINGDSMVVKSNDTSKADQQNLFLVTVGEGEVIYHVIATAIDGDCVVSSVKRK